MTLAVAVLAACEDASLLPDSQIILLNLPDDFALEVTALKKVTDGRSYLWPVTGTQAVVDITQAISSGSAILQIRDGAGVVVYAEDIRNDVDGPTDVGAVGIWQIVVVLTKVSGTFSFTVQRAP